MMANTRAIWQQAAHTSRQLSAPSCSTRAIQKCLTFNKKIIVQELCESQGGRPGLSVLTSLLVSVDVKIY